MKTLYDVIVIGGGPAGLTAALYLARARYSVLVVEKEKFGGQITITADVVNYPGVMQGSGTEITETMRRQAESFGAEFLLAEVTGLDMQGDLKTVHTSKGDVKAFGVLLATGAHPRKVGFKGEEEFKGRGVAYCATCDGEFFTGLDIFVVGGGFAAAEEAVFLTRYARSVTILVRSDDFTCAVATADLAKKHPKIKICYNTVVDEVAGGSILTLLRYRNVKTGEVTEYSPPEGEGFGVFVFAGYTPATELVKGMAELDDCGYIITDANQKTNVEGLYAAGDVCIKNLRQVVTAVSDGARAATELEKYACMMQAKTGIKPEFKIPERAVGQVEAKPAQAEDSAEIFTDAIKAQLQTVFGRMEKPLVLELSLDDREISKELQYYAQEMAALTDKLTVKAGSEAEKPCVRVLSSDGSYTGIAFHGVPGGHEFNSFVIALYNAAGPGQPVDEATLAKIKNLNKKLNLKILVSLSCTMCPELVMAAQRIAAENANITAEVYDINHFAELKTRYNIMSVPCMVINDNDVLFGKKTIAELVEILSKY